MAPTVETVGGQAAEQSIRPKACFRGASGSQAMKSSEAGPEMPEARVSEARRDLLTGRLDPTALRARRAWSSRLWALIWSTTARPLRQHSRIETAGPSGQHQIPAGRAPK